MEPYNNLLQTIGLPALATAFLLSIPLIAMQFTDEVIWTLSDFIIAGALLFSTGLTYKVVTRSKENTTYRLAIGFALFSGLFLIWANLAVGIVGSENNPANMMYFGVIAVGLIGGLVSRFKASGLMRTMVAMAIAQTLVAVIILVGRMYTTPPSSVTEILGINGFFIVLFLLAALLFRHDAERNDE